MSSIIATSLQYLLQASIPNEIIEKASRHTLENNKKTWNFNLISFILYDRWKT